jgi:hypothetical protein
MATLRQIRERRQKDRLERQQKQQETELGLTIPPLSQSNGSARLIQLILNKGNALITSLIPVLINQAKQLGIEALGQASEKLPDVCPSPEVLEKILEIRNLLVNRLNTASQSINQLSTSITGLSTIVDVQRQLISTLSITKLATSLASKFIPSPPGVPGIVTSTISDLEDLKNKILFNATGGPQLEKSIANLNSGVLAINAVNQQLSKIITLLNSIDNVLKKCSPDSDLVPLNGNLILLQQTIQEQQNILPQQSQSTISETPTNIYQGFTLEIQEIPFSEGLVQKVGIAKNNEGVILLRTKPSFTLNPQILIEELQFIINRDSLKAN